jgi:hypothetical protein
VQANIWRHTVTDEFWIAQRIKIGNEQWYASKAGCRECERFHDNSKKLRKRQLKVL